MLLSVYNNHTYRTANFLGLRERTGNSIKHMTKHAKAPRLQTANPKIRSQRLTMCSRMIHQSAKHVLSAILRRSALTASVPIVPLYIPVSLLYHEGCQSRRAWQGTRAWQGQTHMLENPHPPEVGEDRNLILEGEHNHYCQTGSKMTASKGMAMTQWSQESRLAETILASSFVT